MNKQFIQPEYILEKIASKDNERLNSFIVKNLEFNYKPIFLKGGIYSVRECLVEDGVTGWISSKIKTAVCVDVINHARNMIILFQSLDDKVPAKTSLINRVLVALKIKKPTMVVPAMPKQIIVQLVGTIADERKDDVKS